MRFCVSCRQSDSVRKEANELKVEYKDIEFIDNYIESAERSHYIILKIPKYTKINWNLLLMYNEKLAGKFYIAISDLKDSIAAKEHNIKFYWDYPVSTYYELNNLIDIGSSQVILAPPLVFEQKTIKEKNIKVRLVPNYAFNDFLVNDNGVCGGWIRPEGLILWEDIVESCEFIHGDLQNERAMLRIYKSGMWQDDYQLL